MATQEKLTKDQITEETTPEELGAIALPEFNIELFFAGTRFGYVGRAGIWAVNVQAPDNFRNYYYQGRLYIQRISDNAFLYVVPGYSGGDVGYTPKINYANSFRKSGSRLVSDLNDQSLAVFSLSSSYLYCNDNYTVLGVTFNDL